MRTKQIAHGSSRTARLSHAVHTFGWDMRACRITRWYVQLPEAMNGRYWVAAKELKFRLSYHNSEALLFGICIPIMGTETKFLNSNPSFCLAVSRQWPCLGQVHLGWQA